jgi:hypothetical protein
MTDGLSTLYRDLLGGSYDCVDRIVLNAYFRMGHDPGGFRVWWRALTGSDETLENAYLMRLAGRFSRRVRGYAKAHGIPVIDCPVGQRKHEFAEQYLAKTKVTRGLFLVLVGRAPALVWTRRRPPPHRKKDAGPLRQPLFLSYSRSRLWPSDDQDQRPPSLPRPGSAWHQGVDVNADVVEKRDAPIGNQPTIAVVSLRSWIQVAATAALAGCRRRLFARHLLCLADYVWLIPLEVARADVARSAFYGS